MMNATFFIVPIAIIMIVMVLLRFFRAGKRMVEGFRMEAPRLAIPERQRGQMRSDGSEIRTVRLPNKCSNCGAQLSPKDIDWVGPLEAECNYCGATVRAQFEKV
jgi:DNA-directed RNA polymerase subunit RPC12/RpoP